MKSGRAAAFRRLGIVFEALGHLAVWVGLYMLGAVAMVMQVGLPPRSAGAGAAALAAAAFTGIGVYLIDRVKLQNRWLDPADLTGHQRRFVFLVRVIPRVRSLAVMSIAAGMIAAWITHPALVLAPAVAVAGVLVYAGRPRDRGRRVKDLLIVKNAAVAAAITGFAVLMAVGAALDRDDALGPAITSVGAALGVAAGYLVLRVLSDAIACDIDDVESDAKFGTRTLPVVLGVGRARSVGLIIRVVAVGVLLWSGAGDPQARFAWAAATTATTLATLALEGAGAIPLRDLVDLRLAVDAGIAAALMAAGVFAGMG